MKTEISDNRVSHTASNRVMGERMTFLRRGWFNHGGANSGSLSADRA